MIDDILNAIPEDKRAEVKPYLDKLIDLDALTAEQFSDLRKSNKVVKSLFESELSTLNEKYKTEKVPVLVDKLYADKMATLNPETDPDKLKARLDNETDPTKKEMLQLRYQNALAMKEVAEIKADRERLAKVEEMAKKKDILKSYITEKAYEGIDIDPFAALDIEVAQKTIDSIAGGVNKFKNDLVEKYKGLGNTAPSTGGQIDQSKLTIGQATMAALKQGITK